MYHTTCPKRRYCDLFSSVSWHCCKQALHRVINRFPDLSLEEKSLKPLLAKVVKNAYAPEKGVRKVPLKMPILLLKMAQRSKKVVIGTKSASKMPFLGLQKCPSTVKIFLYLSETAGRDASSIFRRCIILPSYEKKTAYAYECAG